jgi:hypothetical protein
MYVAHLSTPSPMAASMAPTRCSRSASRSRQGSAKKEAVPACAASGESEATGDRKALASLPLGTAAASDVRL